MSEIGGKKVKNVEIKDLILREIDKLPEAYLYELLDFIRFLESKVNEEKMETVFLSESSLKKDWLKEEEDEAWRDL